jgi:hypothetical protein
LSYFSGESPQNVHVVPSSLDSGNAVSSIPQEEQGPEKMHHTDMIDTIFHLLQTKNSTSISLTLLSTCASQLCFPHVRPNRLVLSTLAALQSRYLNVYSFY